MNTLLTSTPIKYVLKNHDVYDNMNQLTVLDAGKSTLNNMNNRWFIHLLRKRTYLEYLTILVGRLLMQISHNLDR